MKEVLTSPEYSKPIFSGIAGGVVGGILAGGAISSVALIVLAGGTAGGLVGSCTALVIGAIILRGNDCISGIIFGGISIVGISLGVFTGIITSVGLLCSSGVAIGSAAGIVGGLTAYGLYEHLKA